MVELFITEVRIDSVKDIRRLDILMSKLERKHLILTGVNGCGKTSLLEAVRNYLSKASSEYHEWLSHRAMPEEMALEDSVSYHPSGVENISIVFSMQPERRVFETLGKEWIFEFYPARRNPQFEPPSEVERVAAFEGRNFLKYLLNLTADRAFALDDDPEAARRAGDWLDGFQQILRELYADPGLEFKFNRRDYHYYIHQLGKKPINLYQLPDGFSGIIDVLTDLLMKIEEMELKPELVQGVVMIDEIETHLHVGLQKRILPFFSKIFPRIQFIVTTHSPFVLNSVDNAVICDLEKRIVTEDLSAYSSELIVESYFDQDKYSEILKGQVAEYEKLMGLEKRTLEQKDRLLELKSYLETAPKYLADELASKILDIKLKYMKPAH